MRVANKAPPSSNSAPAPEADPDASPDVAAVVRHVAEKLDDAVPVEQAPVAYSPPQRRFEPQHQKHLGGPRGGVRSIQQPR